MTGARLPWSDPAFSARMLREHLAGSRAREPARAPRSPLRRHRLLAGAGFDAALLLSGEIDTFPRDLLASVGFRDLERTGDRDDLLVLIGRRR